MALHIGEPKTENTKPERIEASKEANKFDNNMNYNDFGNGTVGRQQDFPRSLSFGDKRGGFMQSSGGSDYTRSIAENIVKIYEKANIITKPTVSYLDKEVLPTLSYSCVFVSMELNNEISYYIVLLEKTGRAPLQAQSMIAELNNSQRQPGSFPSIYTTDDAINTILHNEIIATLQQTYGSKKIKSADGIVLPAEHNNIEDLAPMLAKLAYDACILTLNVGGNGAVEDLDIVVAIDKFKSQNNKKIRYESIMSRQIRNNALNRPVRSDWTIDLTLLDTSAYTQSLNMENTKSVITRTSGFVDALPEEVILPQAPGVYNNQVMKSIQCRPHIIVTSNSAESPTTGYMLLGLVSSLVMTKREMWLGALRPSDPKNHVGALNVITKIDDGEGAKLDLTNKKYSMEEVYAVISRMFPLEPVISVDVESFGPQSFYMSALTAASQSANPLARENASKMIIQTAHHLTHGFFPIDFNPGEIFAHDSILIPMGTWSDKTGIKDLREIDLAFITSHIDDMNLINKWILSCVPSNVSGQDPFLSKVDVISKIIPSAEISGKATRCTFSAKFINMLSSAVIQAGLRVDYEAEIKFTENANLSVLSSCFNTAGIGGNVTGFAREAIQTGPNYNTPYTHTGFGYGFQR